MVQLVFDGRQAGRGPGAGADLGRLLPARRRGARVLGRRQARARGQPPGRLPGRRVSRELLLLAHLARAQRQRRASAATTPPGRRSASCPRCGWWRPRAARRSDAWLAYEGNWGQKARGLFNAPTGPNTNKKWSAPIDWEGSCGTRRSRSRPGRDRRHGHRLLLLRRRGGVEVYADMLESPLGEPDPPDHRGDDRRRGAADPLVAGRAAADRRPGRSDRCCAARRIHWRSIVRSP